MPHRLYTPLHFPKEPRVDISMDFISSLSRLRKERDSIFIVIDKFSKTIHFIYCRKNKDVTNLVNIFFKKVVQLHSVLRSIMSNRDVKFLSYFWKVLWSKLSTKLLFSAICHPQTNGQTKVLNMTLTQLLRAFIQKNPKN